MSSGYIHLGKLQSMQAKRTNNGLKPHEIYNVNMEGSPYANLEKYYYYVENDPLKKNPEYIDEDKGKIRELITITTVLNKHSLNKKISLPYFQKFKEKGKMGYLPSDFITVLMDY